MKLFEITTNVSKLANEFIFLMDRERSDRVFGSGDFKEICTEPGNCSMVSNEFREFLLKKGIKSSNVTGIHAVDESWAKSAKVQPGSDEDAHTVTLVNGTTVDFTARQFDPKAEFPRIRTYSQFKKEWREVD